MRIRKQTFQNIINRIRKEFWWIAHPGDLKTYPVFITGVQRSGTTMIGSCLNKSPELRYYNENNGLVYERFKLKNGAVIQSILDGCRGKIAAFKPLLDSHRVAELLTRFDDSRAIWIYRNHVDRAASAVAKFGSHNYEILKAISKGQQLDSWQAQGLTKEDIAVIQDLDFNDTTPIEAAAVFWYLRNKLFFNQGLQNNNQVLPVAYENFVRQPAESMNVICRFIGCHFSARMIATVHTKSIGRHTDSMLTQSLNERCDRLYQQLEKTREHREQMLLSST